MAKQNLPLTTVARTGIAIGPTSSLLTANDVANGNKLVIATGRECLLILNEDVAQKNINFDLPGTVDGRAITDPFVAVNPDVMKIVGPFPQGLYGQIGGDDPGELYLSATSALVKYQALLLPAVGSEKTRASAEVGLGSRVIVPVFPITRAGISMGADGAEVVCDTVNDHYFYNTGKEIVAVRNSGAGTPAAGFKFGYKPDGADVADRTEGIAAAGSQGDWQLFGPFAPALYNQHDGTLHFYGTHSDLRFQVFKVY